MVLLIKNNGLLESVVMGPFLVRIFGEI